MPGEREKSLAEKHHSESVLQGFPAQADHVPLVGRVKEGPFLGFSIYLGQGQDLVVDGGDDLVHEDGILDEGEEEEEWGHGRPGVAADFRRVRVDWQEEMVSNK